MKIQEPTKIELSDQNSGVISLKKNAPNNSRVSLHGKMKEAKPVALVLKIPDLCGVVNNTVLTDG
jgi:hypothetical protein